MAAVTAGQASVQATATAATLTPCAPAIGAIASATLRLRASFSPLNSGLRERQSFSGRASARSTEKRPREQARLHRAVDDDAGLMGRAPGQLGGGDIPPDRREGRLQRIHMAERLGRFQLADIVVGEADGAQLAFLLQVEKGLPVVLDSAAVLGSASASA